MPQVSCDLCGCTGYEKWPLTIVSAWGVGLEKALEDQLIGIEYWHIALEVPACGSVCMVSSGSLRH